MSRHPLERDLNASASDILSAIQKGFRAIVDVKGKLAEFFFNKQLEGLRRARVIEEFTWSDKDGQPDFFVRFRGRQLRIECKNIRSKELFKTPPAYKVELQKTRNSKDGTNTRGYKHGEFELLAVCLFNHTGKWEYLYVCTKRLERRGDQREFLKIMQKVPFTATGPWKATLLEALKETVGRR